MLVLSRLVGEELVIDVSGILIRIAVNRIHDEKKVRLGIVAPRSIPVHRREVWEAVTGRKLPPIGEVRND